MLVNGDRSEESCLLHDPEKVMFVSTDGWSRAVPRRDTIVPLMGGANNEIFSIGVGTGWRIIIIVIIHKFAIMRKPHFYLLTLHYYVKRLHTLHWKDARDIDSGSAVVLVSLGGSQVIEY